MAANPRESSGRLLRPDQKFYYVGGIMDTAVAAQKKANASFQVVPFAASNRVLFTEFTKTDSFQELWGRAASELLRPPGGHELQGVVSMEQYEQHMEARFGNVLRDLIPCVFQKLVEHKYIQSEVLGHAKGKTHGITLSYEPTKEIYSAMNNDAPYMSNGVGLDGVQGVSNPDFCTIEDRKITRSYEVTLSGDVEHLRRSLHGIRRNLEENGMFFSRDHELIYIVPQGKKVPLERMAWENGIILPNYLTIREESIEHGEFIREMRRILKEKGWDPDTASLGDILEAAKSQHILLTEDRRRQIRSARAQARLAQGAEMFPNEATSFYDTPGNSYHVRLSDQVSPNLDDSYEESDERFA